MSQLFIREEKKRGSEGERERGRKNERKRERDCKYVLSYTYNIE